MHSSMITVKAPEMLCLQIFESFCCKIQKLSEIMMALQLIGELGLSSTLNRVVVTSHWVNNGISFHDKQVTAQRL